MSTNIQDLIVTLLTDKNFSNSFADEAFRREFLDLFSTKIKTEAGVEWDSKNPDKIRQLQSLIEFCIKNKNLEGEAISIPAPKETIPEIHPRPAENISSTEVSTVENTVRVFPEENETSCLSPISMMVLGGFIAVAGIAAIAIAFALASGFGTLLVAAGAVAVLAGTAVGAKGSFRFFNQSPPNTVQDEDFIVIYDSESSDDEPSSSSDTSLGS